MHCINFTQMPTSLSPCSSLTSFNHRPSESIVNHRGCARQESPGAGGSGQAPSSNDIWHIGARAAGGPPGHQRHHMRQPDEGKAQVQCLEGGCMQLPRICRFLCSVQNTHTKLNSIHDCRLVVTHIQAMSLLGLLHDMCSKMTGCQTYISTFIACTIMACAACTLSEKVQAGSMSAAAPTACHSRMQSRLRAYVSTPVSVASGAAR